MLLKYLTETTEVAPPTASLQVQHVHFRLIGRWDHKSAITRCRSLALCEIKNLARLRRLVGHISRSSAPVAPTDVADNPGVLDALHGSVERFDSPILKTIGPGKLVELDEVDAERIHFEDVFVDGFGNIHGPIAAGFVVEVVGRLGQHLNAGILHLGWLIGGFLEGFGLLHHDSPMPSNFLRQSTGMQTAIYGEP